MNAIKNTIVTVTLLAVGFGAYTVLQSPPQHSLDDNELTWDANADLLDPDVPKSSLPDTTTLATSNGPDPSFLDQIGAPRSEPPNTSQTLSAGGSSSSNTASTDQAVAGNVPPSEYAVDQVPSTGNQYSDNASIGQPNDGQSQTISALTPFDNLANSVPGTQDALGQPGGYYDEAATAEGDYSSNSAAPADSSNDVDLPPPSDLTTRPTNSRPGPSASEFENTMNYVQMQLQQDQLGEALLTLSQSYRSGLQQDQVSRMSTLIDQLAGTVIYSPRSYLQPAHQVQADETLDSIAQKFQLPVQFLARVNGIEIDYQPIAGETLKVVQGPFHAVVHGVKGELTVYLGDYYAGRFAVQLGSDAPRDGGEFEVIEKSAGREFFDRRSGYRIAKEDSANPYGNFWIGLRGEQVTAAHNVGFHVANDADPGSGCFRLSKVDAQDLSAILSVGSRVSFVR